MNPTPQAADHGKSPSLLRILRALVNPKLLKSLSDLLSLYFRGGIIISTRTARQDGGSLVASTLIQPDGDVVTQLDPEVFENTELMQLHLKRLRTQCDALRLSMFNLRAADSQYLWGVSGLAVFLEHFTSQSYILEVVRWTLPIVAWRVFVAIAEASQKWNERLSRSKPAGRHVVMNPLYFLIVPTLILAGMRYFGVIVGRIGLLEIEMLRPLGPALFQLVLSALKFIVPWLIRVVLWLRTRRLLPVFAS